MDNEMQEEPQSPEPSLREALRLLNQLPADRRRAVLKRIRLLAKQEPSWLTRLVRRVRATLKRLVESGDKE